MPQLIKCAFGELIHRSITANENYIQFIEF